PWSCTPCRTCPAAFRRRSSSASGTRPPCPCTTRRRPWSPPSCPSCPCPCPSAGPPGARHWPRSPASPPPPPPAAATDRYAPSLRPSPEFGKWPVAGPSSGRPHVRLAHADKPVQLLDKRLMKSGDSPDGPRVGEARTGPERCPAAAAPARLLSLGAAAGGVQ